MENFHVLLSGKIVRTFAKAKSEPVSQAEGARPRQMAVARPERLNPSRNSFTWAAFLLNPYMISTHTYFTEEDFNTNLLK